MMKPTSLASILLLTVVFQGCTTNYRYMGLADVQDSDNKPRKALISWTKTSTWIYDKAPGTATLQTECGKSLQFKQEQNGVHYIGDPNNDTLTGQEPPITTDTICGEFVYLKNLADYSGGDISVSIKCVPYDSGWGKKQHYISASSTPYIFAIKTESKKSMLGEPFEIPILDCKHKDRN